MIQMIKFYDPNTLSIFNNYSGFILLALTIKIITKVRNKTNFKIKYVVLSEVLIIRIT